MHHDVDVLLDGGVVRDGNGLVAHLVVDGAALGTLLLPVARLPAQADAVDLAHLEAERDLVVLHGHLLDVAERGRARVGGTADPEELDGVFPDVAHVVRGISEPRLVALGA